MLHIDGIIGQNKVNTLMDDVSDQGACQGRDEAVARHEVENVEQNP